MDDWNSLACDGSLLAGLILVLFVQVVVTLAMRCLPTYIVLDVWWWAGRACEYLIDEEACIVDPPTHLSNGQPGSESAVPTLERRQGLVVVKY